jgi:hypothetical protein
MQDLFDESDQLSNGIDDVENSDGNEEQQIADLAAEVWSKPVEQSKPGNPGWCAPPPFILKLDTGDTFITQDRGNFGYEHILQTKDGCELTVDVPGTNKMMPHARIVTPEGVKISWGQSGRADVTLPDGTTFSPEGAFSVQINGKPVMSVTYNGENIQVRRPDGNSVTFHMYGIKTVSSLKDGVINHVSLEGKPGGGKQVKR